MAQYKNPPISLDDDPIEELPEENDTDKSDESTIEKSELPSDERDYYSKEPIYFAFIDVLGFRKTFDDNRQTRNEKKEETDNFFADKFKRVFTYYFDLMGSANFNQDNTNLYYAGQTSDSLYFYTERIDYLLDFMKIFSHLNVYAMSQDVFFRGGIAKGSLSFREKYQFYGDSVIYAYLLENEISKNPIIVIDENTVKDIEAFNQADSDLLISKHEEKRGRGRRYLKPFSYLEGKISLSIKEDTILQEILKANIENKIVENKSKFEYDARNYEKYVFLYDEYDEYKDRFCIG